MGDGQGFMMPCYPVMSLMLAMNVTKLDFFSLDVEGAEYPILDTLPFDRLDVSVLAVEVAHGRSRTDTKDMMKRKGYTAHQDLKMSDPKIQLYVDDVIFVNEKLAL